MPLQIHKNMSVKATFTYISKPQATNTKEIQVTLIFKLYIFFIYIHTHIYGGAERERERERGGGGGERGREKKLGRLTETQRRKERWREEGIRPPDPERHSGPIGSQSLTQIRERPC